MHACMEFMYVCIYVCIDIGQCFVCMPACMHASTLRRVKLSFARRRGKCRATMGGGAVNKR